MATEILNDLSVSVIIPTLNEKENIAKLINEICLLLHDNVKQHEVVVVDDSSSDGTIDIVRMLTQKDGNIKLICRPYRQGLGSAIRDGIEHSANEVIITMDADFSHPTQLIATLVQASTKFDIVVGSRYTAGGGMKAPLGRVFLSRMLNHLIRMMLGLEIRDCTGGFLAVRRDVFYHLNINGRSGDYAFELLYKARKKGFRIVEVPFVYEYRKKGNSKTSIIGYGVRYMLSAFLLRINHPSFSR